MIILGIDPGETLVGFGVIRKDGSRLTLMDHGCIRIPSVRRTAAQKLFLLEKKVSFIIQKHRPDIAVVEELFFTKNMKTGIRVAQARGVILFACEKNGVRIIECTPLQVKQGVTGYGKADKKQVQKMIKLILNQKELISQDDTADAVAAAIYASNTMLLLDSNAINPALLPPENIR